MIHYCRGNLLECEADALVNAVNCVGVMDKGIALQFKNQFPAVYEAYVDACKDNRLGPGRIHVVPTGLATGPKYVIHFPTKMHWRNPSKLEYIEAGLAALVLDLRRWDLKSVAIPALGCGSGGLSWHAVKPLIEHALEPCSDIEVFLYAPQEAVV